MTPSNLKYSIFDDSKIDISDNDNVLTYNAADYFCEPVMKAPLTCHETAAFQQHAKSVVWLPTKCNKQ